jgi:hypothetical protein
MCCPEQHLSKHNSKHLRNLGPNAKYFWYWWSYMTRVYTGNLFYQLFQSLNKIHKEFKLTSILRVLQAIPSPLPVVYSVKIVQAE